MGIPVKDIKSLKNSEKEIKDLEESLNNLRKELIFISQRITDNEKVLQEKLTTIVSKEKSTKELTNKKLQEQLEKLVDTVFGGSAKTLVMQALGNHNSTKEELEEIKKLISKLEGGEK